MPLTVITKGGRGDWRELLEYTAYVNASSHELANVNTINHPFIRGTPKRLIRIHIIFLDLGDSSIR